MGVYFACMYAYMYRHTYAGMYTICMPCAIGGQKRMMSYALELELWTILKLGFLVFQVQIQGRLSLGDGLAAHQHTVSPA